jgi:hypothetical protein
VIAAAILVVAAVAPAASSPEGLHYGMPAPWVVVQPLRASTVVVQPFRAATVVVQPFRAGSGSSQAAQCDNWADCRTRALDAASRKEYEAFHDLAWRAVQLAPKQDPALLFLLARAQSLSGRPHDALVMLRRLSAAAVAREAIEDPDFERVRRLREWPELAALLAAPPGTPEAPEKPEAREKVALPEKAGTFDKVEKPEKAEKTEKSGEPEKAGLDEAPAKAEAKPVEPLFSEALTFASASFRPAALVYDAVSRRFIISDTDVSRLAVIDEFSHQLATLASGQSAGFGTVTALTIDPRAGDLWVASVDGSSGRDVPALHKLQLISGRVLKTFATDGTASGRFVDITVAADGTLHAAQEVGTVWRLTPNGGTLAPTLDVSHSRFTTITSSDRGVVYVGMAHRVMWITSSDSGRLTTADGDDLTDLAQIRWHRRSLVALQRAVDGSYSVIRLRLSRDGRSVAAVDVLDPSVRTPNPSAATIAGDVFYYLAETGGPELSIRRIVLR